MTDTNSVNEGSCAMPCSVAFPLSFHKGNKQWYKKRKGKLYYFGTDRDIAVERFAVWSETGIHCRARLNEFLNIWLSEHRETLSFDEWYISYCAASSFIETHGKYAGIDVIKQWNTYRSTVNTEWQTRVGRVYIVRAGAHIKIGTALNVASRVKTLQTGSAVPLQVVLDLPGGRDHEEELHSRFHRYRVRHNGEWFTETGDLKWFVSLMCD